MPHRREPPQPVERRPFFDGLWRRGDPFGRRALCDRRDRHASLAITAFPRIASFRLLSQDASSRPPRTFDSRDRSRDSNSLDTRFGFANGFEGRFAAFRPYSKPSGTQGGRRRAALRRRRRARRWSRGAARARQVEGEQHCKSDPGRQDDNTAISDFQQDNVIAERGAGGAAADTRGHGARHSHIKSRPPRTRRDLPALQPSETGRADTDFDDRDRLAGRREPGRRRRSDRAGSEPRPHRSARTTTRPRTSAPTSSINPAAGSLPMALAIRLRSSAPP